jgi:hypothetical protein
VQGFPCDGQLQSLRDTLRCAVHTAGLGQNLDQRYRIRTAHMTAVRFFRPLRDVGRLAAKLQQLRRRDFGAMQVSAVELVENDWYMSHDRVRVLHTYRLNEEPVL